MVVSVEWLRLVVAQASADVDRHDRRVLLEALKWLSLIHI